MSWKKTVQNIVLALMIALGGLPAVASAVCSSGVQTCSSSYQVDEAFFGTGGELNACSTTYCSKQSAGETGVGNTASTSYQAQAGFNTDRTPSLTMVVNTSSINLGILTPGTTKTATATFNVKSYLASGYIVTTNSPGPKDGSYVMASPASPTASNASSEQFGMNVVSNPTSNSTCNTINPSQQVAGSADPVQVPGATFSFGFAATNYNQACKFMYHDGDTIAQSNSSSGETDYTISYIFNITSLTPGGQYTMNQSLVATSTF